MMFARWLVIRWTDKKVMASNRTLEGAMAAVRLLGPDDMVLHFDAREW